MRNDQSMPDIMSRLHFVNAGLPGTASDQHRSRTLFRVLRAEVVASGWDSMRVTVARISRDMPRQTTRTAIGRQANGHDRPLGTSKAFRYYLGLGTTIGDLMSSASGGLDPSTGPLTFCTAATSHFPFRFSAAMVMRPNR